MKRTRLFRDGVATRLYNQPKAERHSTRPPEKEEECVRLRYRDMTGHYGSDGTTVEGVQMMNTRYTNSLSFCLVLAGFCFAGCACNGRYVGPNPSPREKRAFLFHMLYLHPGLSKICEIFHYHMYQTKGDDLRKSVKHF